MRLIDYLTGTAKVLQTNDIFLLREDEKKEIKYIFYNPSGDLTEAQKSFFSKEVQETLRYGYKSSICENIKFEKTKYFDLVVIYQNDKVYDAYPIVLRKKMGPQVIYDLILWYNAKTKEYNLINEPEKMSMMAPSKISGNIKVLELFLNYCLGGICYSDVYSILKDSNDYTINGINIRREDNMVKVTIVNPILKEKMSISECEILNDAFNMLMERWYEAPLK